MLCVVPGNIERNDGTRKGKSARAPRCNKVRCCSACSGSCFRLRLPPKISILVSPSTLMSIDWTKPRSKTPRTATCRFRKRGVQSCRSFCVIHPCCGRVATWGANTKQGIIKRASTGNLFQRKNFEIKHHKLFEQSKEIVLMHRQ